MAAADRKKSSGSRVRDRLGIQRTSPPSASRGVRDQEQQRRAIVEQGFKKQPDKTDIKRTMAMGSPGQVRQVVVQNNSFEKSPQTPQNANVAPSRGHLGKSTDSESNSMHSAIPVHGHGKKGKKHTDSELREQRAVKRIQLSDLNLDQLEKEHNQGNNDSKNISDSLQQATPPKQHQYQTLSDRIFKKDIRSSLASESSAERLQHFLKNQQKNAVNESGEKYDPLKSSITQSIYSFQKKAIDSRPKEQVYETITSSHYEHEKIMRDAGGATKSAAA